jgi:hypothetical protein
MILYFFSSSDDKAEIHVDTKFELRYFKKVVLRNIELLFSSESDCGLLVEGVESLELDNVDMTP